MRPTAERQNLRFAKTFATVGIRGISAMHFAFLALERDLRRRKTTPRNTADSRCLAILKLRRKRDKCEAAASCRHKRTKGLKHDCRIDDHQQSGRIRKQCFPWREAVNDEAGASFGDVLKFVRRRLGAGGRRKKNCPRKHALWRTSMSITVAGCDGRAASRPIILSVELWIATKFPPVKSWASSTKVSGKPNLMVCDAIRGNELATSRCETSAMRRSSVSRPQAMAGEKRLPSSLTPMIG